MALVRTCMSQDAASQEKNAWQEKMLHRSVLVCFGFWHLSRVLERINYEYQGTTVMKTGRIEVASSKGY